MQRQLTYIDFQVGRTFVLGPHTLTAEDIVAFARAFDPQDFHLDEAAGKSSVLGGLAASGWHTSALLWRMICDAFLLETASLGSNGIDEVKWLKPVFAGDVLAGTLEIVGARISSRKPDVGIVNFRAGLSDQQGTEKISMSGHFFVKVLAP